MPCMMCRAAEQSLKSLLGVRTLEVLMVSASFTCSPPLPFWWTADAWWIAVVLFQGSLCVLLAFDVED